MPIFLISHVVESWKNTNTRNLWLGTPEPLPETGVSTNEKPRIFLHDRQGQYGLYSEVALAKNNVPANIDRKYEDFKQQILKATFHGNKRILNDSMIWYRGLTRISYKYSSNDKINGSRSFLDIEDHYYRITLI